MRQGSPIAVGGRSPCTHVPQQLLPAGSLAKAEGQHLIGVLPWARPESASQPLHLLWHLLPRSIKAAGGFLIQVLPFAEDETIEALERNITAAGSVTDMLAKGMNAADISEQLLKGLGGKPPF